MDDVLENARQHFMAKRLAPRRQIDVPEWGATFYVKSLNLEESAEIEAARSQGAGAAIIKTICVRCVDAEGKRVFKKHHERILSQEVDPAILSRIVLEIVREDVTPEQVEKN